MRKLKHRHKKRMHRLKYMTKRYRFVNRNKPGWKDFWMIRDWRPFSDE